MPTYSEAPDSAVELLTAVMQRHEEHRKLKEAGVTVELQFAYGKEKKDGSVEDAIKWHGRKALGFAKIRKLDDRASGMTDAKILVDGQFWQDAEDPEREALLDHELYHLELVTDDVGDVEKDDSGRPKLKMRKHDVEVGWFTAVALRNGAHSQELIQAARIFDADGQAYWPQLAGGGTAGAVAALKRTPAFKALAKSVARGEVSFSVGDKMPRQAALVAAGQS